MCKRLFVLFTSFAVLGLVVPNVVLADVIEVRVAAGENMAESFDGEAAAPLLHIEYIIEPANPDTDGLVAYYPLEKDALDTSGNSNAGIVEGDPTYVEGPAGYGMAMEFDGDDHVDTGNTEDLAEWTIACWAKSPSAPSGDPSSASGPVHRDRNYQFNWNHQNDTPRGSVAVRSAGGWHAASFGTLKADTWYHLAGTYDGEELKAYKDGVLITTNDAPSGPPLAEAGTLKLGKHATAEQYFTGTVDEVIVYSRVLPIGEIRYLVGSTHIILVTEEIDWDMDGLRDDHSLESFLVSEGHSVDVRPDYWKVLTPDKIAELNAADLIIFSRLAWSNHYDDVDETFQWNSIRTPLLQMSAWFVRNIEPRWNWINSDVKQRTPLIYAQAVDPHHPIFRGVPLTAFDPSNPDSPANVVQMIDPLIGSGHTSFINTTNMGNGHLIAKPVQADMGWIAEWDAGVEFYEGADQYARGRRMLFCAGTQEIEYFDEDRQEVMKTAQGELNLTAEGLQMFRNAIAYLHKPEFTGSAGKVEDFETEDFSKFPWSSYGDESWETTRSERHSGYYSARSGSIEDGEESTLEVSIDCVWDYISFYCKVSCESGFDKLTFYIDGLEQGTWSGQEDWAEVSFHVREGTRTFKWAYSKDSSVSEGNDTVWIDDIVFPIGP